jgi:uncharacterized protein (TIGR02117 family)
LIGILAKLLIFFIISVLTGFIPVNCSFAPEPYGIEIYIASNGVHTDFVFPIENSIMDWRSLFSADQFADGWLYAPYVAFGWGDRGFYLNTPEWKDLRLHTAVNALFVPSNSAMHVTLWPKPEEDEYTVRVSLTDSEYRDLVKYITDSFKWGDDNQVIKIDYPGYGDYDLFFESNLKFHLFRTCNVWTNQGLKKTGIRTSLWTPYDRPILYQLSKNKFRD